MDKTLSNLGLCARARGLVDGTDIVCSEMALNKIKLIFLANNASLLINSLKSSFFHTYGLPRFQSIFLFNVHIGSLYFFEKTFFF